MEPLLQFQEKNSNYAIEIMESDQCHLLRQLSQKEIDVAICRLDFLSDKEYEAIPLCTDEMVLICNKDTYPFEQGSEIDLSGFKLENIYTLTKDSDVYRLAKMQLNDIGFKGELKGTFPRHMMIYPLLVQKGGCAILPRQLANLQLFPRLTYYRIRNAVKTKIGIVKPIPNDENPQLYEKANVLLDFFKNL